MPKASIDELTAFVTIAREHSFTRAAAKLAVSQSALSHVMRGLEAKLGVRLLIRTTRSVGTTEAGERLLQGIASKLDDIESELNAVSELRERPMGTIRLTATEYAASAILLPALQGFAKNYPDIRVEIVTDYGLTDIAAERFDAGVRPGDIVSKDMIAVRIGPDQRMAVAGSPTYFAGRSEVHTPKDLTDHNCINLRTPTHGGLFVWEFQKGQDELKVRVDGQFVFTTSTMILEAGLSGLGLIYLTEGQIQPHLDTGRLVRILEDWCPPFPGYHLYYPSRRQPTAAFALLVKTLRYLE
ncbi:LysR family transcriptional regulator [Ochrobactrum sp. BTU1]|uniref:LysR family transcriptional regulator n=1 Tax=Ochrobactrum sp. BTU1 TaxID=2840456 RepID=UPI001C048E63|nr:LysR family transcriptional regulator [Ochrobactrum sp. BTU1]